MKNTLVPILALLQDTFEGQDPAAPRKWSDEVQIIEAKTSGADENCPEVLVWWVSADKRNALLSPAQVRELTNQQLLENHGASVKKKVGNVTRDAYGVRIGELRAQVKGAQIAAPQVVVLNRRIRQLELQLQHATDASHRDYAMTAFLDLLSDSFKAKKSAKPFRLQNKPQAKSKKPAEEGMASLLLSDWHAGEHVDGRQIGDMNDYNRELTESRGNRIFSKTLEILLTGRSGSAYDGIAVPMAGDMLSGNIHEELRITNEAPIHEVLVDLASQLTEGLVSLADNFQAVYVPAVSGNHGRIDKKPTSKNAVKDNYDWLLYKFVERMVQGRLGDKCNVEFEISDSLDLTYRLYNTTYLLTHGDQLPGGVTANGFWQSMIEMAKVKKARAKDTSSPEFDYMVAGHSHRYGAVANVISNGSLKGYDEWAYRMNFEYQKPVQALWITHADYGITSHIPVYAEDLEKDGSSLVVPVVPGYGLRART